MASKTTKAKTTQKPKHDMTYSNCNVDEKGKACDIFTGFKTMDEATAAAKKKDCQFAVLGSAVEGRVLGFIGERTRKSTFWDLTEEVEFDVNLQRRRYLVALDPDLAEKLASEAHQRGLTTETLVNLWLSEKLQQTAA